jgi:hypothetical protein
MDATARLSCEGRQGEGARPRAATGDRCQSSVQGKGTSTDDERDCDRDGWIIDVVAKGSEDGS